MVFGQTATTTTSSSSCLSVANNFPVRTVADHSLIDLSGGPFVMGSAATDPVTATDTKPQWVDVPPISVGQTAITEAQWHAVMGGGATQQNYPKARISWQDAAHFLEQFNTEHEEEFGLLREHEWEYVARGPVVNLREVMEEEGVGVCDFADWTDRRFENFVESLTIGSQIHVDPKSNEISKLLRGAGPLYGWRVYATPSGKFSTNEIWAARTCEAGSKPADVGTPNAYGAYHMNGNLWEWVADLYHPVFSVKNPIHPDSNQRIGFKNFFRVIRGGSWNLGAWRVRSAYRFRFLYYYRNVHVGFRIVQRNN